MTPNGPTGFGNPANIETIWDFTKPIIPLVYVSENGQMDSQKERTLTTSNHSFRMGSTYSSSLLTS